MRIAVLSFEPLGAAISKVETYVFQECENFAKIHFIDVRMLPALEIIKDAGNELPASLIIK